MKSMVLFIYKTHFWNHALKTRFLFSRSVFFYKPHFLKPHLKTHFYYRVPHLKPYNSRRLFFHLTNKFLMVKIRFYILQIWPFYNISSFFDLCKTLFHKSVFFQKNFFFNIFFQKHFFCILWIINWCLKYVFICTRLWSFMIYYHFLT